MWSTEIRKARLYMINPNGFKIDSVNTKFVNHNV